MSDGRNRPLYSGIGSPKLDEALAQIRQGASQAKGGNILQSLLADAMKPSGRTGGVPGAGSPGAMLSTSLPSVSIPKPPVKDKAAAAREYKKQQQAALKKAFGVIEKGREDGKPYSITERYKIFIDHDVEATTTTNIMNTLHGFEGAAQAQPISDKQRKAWGLPKGSYSIGATGKPELISSPVIDKTIEKEKRTEARKLKQEARNLKTKIAEEKRAEERKIAGEERDIEDVLPREKFEAGEDQRARKMVASLYGASEFDAIKSNLKEAAMEVMVAQKDYRKEGIDFDNAIQKAFEDQAVSESVDKLPEANLGRGERFNPDNYDETVELSKQLYNEGVSYDELITGLEGKGWHKTGNQSAESILNTAGIEKEVVEQETVVPMEQEVETYDVNKAAAIKEKYRSGNIDQETALRLLDEIGMKN